jgi:hypothetical protein
MVVAIEGDPYPHAHLVGSGLSMRHRRRIHLRWPDLVEAVEERRRARRGRMESHPSATSAGPCPTRRRRHWWGLAPTPSNDGEGSSSGEEGRHPSWPTAPPTGEEGRGWSCMGEVRAASALR